MACWILTRCASDTPSHAVTRLHTPSHLWNPASSRAQMREGTRAGAREQGHLCGWVEAADLSRLASLLALPPPCPPPWAAARESCRSRRSEYVVQHRLCMLRLTHVVTYCTTAGRAAQVAAPEYVSIYIIFHIWTRPCPQGHTSADHPVHARAQTHTHTEADHTHTHTHTRGSRSLSHTHEGTGARKPSWRA